MPSCGTRKWNKAIILLCYYSPIDPVRQSLRRVSVWPPTTVPAGKESREQTSHNCTFSISLAWNMERNVAHWDHHTIPCKIRKNFLCASALILPCLVQLHNQECSFFLKNLILKILIYLSIRICTCNYTYVVKIIK